MRCTVIFLSVLLLTSIPSAAALSFDLDSQINLSGNPGDSHEVQLATSGTDVYVVWKDNTAGSNNVLFKKSADNGATFDSTVTLDAGSANSQDPQVSVTGANVYAVWQEGTGPSTIDFAKSTDSGDSFGAQLVLSSSTATSSIPQIASSSSNVYVAWQQGTDVFFSDSADSGATFDAPVSLSASSSEPKIAASASNVYVIWEEGNDISFVKSADSGDTFGAKIDLSGTSGTASTMPEMAASGDDVFIVWKEGTDIFFAKSTDSGDTFSAPIDIGDTGGNLTPNPVVAYDGTTIYVAWSQDVSAKGEISFTTSTDGATFGAVQNLSGNSGDSILPRLDADSGSVAVVWQDDTPGNREILMASSDDSGATFGTVQNLSGNSGISVGPRVSVSGNRVFAVWQDTTPDGGGLDRDILFVTGTAATVSVSFDKSEYTLRESAEITVSDSSSSGTVDVTVSSTSDPAGLTVSLSETGVGTGIFEGTVSFADQTGAGAIQAKAGDTITADYLDQSATGTIFPIIIEVQAGGTAFDSFDYGDIVNVQVEDRNSNQNPAAIETINVNVKSTRDTAGITLTLSETGANTGVFGGSSSTLVFLDGDTKAPLNSVFTVTQTDASKDTTPDLDTATVSVKSTTDTTGISLVLTETGPATGSFKGKLKLSSVSLANSIHVSAGDILTVTSGFFKSNTLVTPISDAAKDGISVTFDADDTVTVTYLAESESVTVKDSADPGGGGGGLVRPGLVLNVLAGLLGGGGSSGAPSATLERLIHVDSLDFPQEIKDMVSEQDPDIPLKPISSELFPEFDFPLTINGQNFALGRFSNTIETQTIQIDEPAKIRFVLYENREIKHISIYANLRDVKTEIPQSDTQILYDDGTLQIVDPNGYFADVDVSVSDIDDLKKEAVFDVVFAKPMNTTKLIMRTWDDKRNSIDTHIVDAFQVVDAKEQTQEPIPAPQPEVQQLVSNSIPLWVKSNAAWWSEQSIDDHDFISGIEYMIKNKIITVQSQETSDAKVADVPEWIRNNAGWWAHGSISDDEFIAGLEYLIERNIVEVSQ